jgi:serine/threonine-protein kinase
MGPALQTLAPSIGPIPRVLLPDTDLDDHSAALIEPASGEMPSPAERGERYQLFGEIARGGMGAVLKGRDTDLGRDLAVKVLLEEHQGKPELARRFVEEAQIGGQLQHPGIVPVYELGTFGDRRPYFTMKLVKGRTLGALLGARHDPRDELPRFLGIFEQVAQTVAYAHARGVLHRDLKPSNVMVGSFGEVQVMDWGLAKVLKEGGVADEERREEPARVEVSVIRTVRHGSSEDESQAGSVLGTPAYMAPEQAGGDVELVDRRADVFGLGSILCEVLSGRPAYTGRNNDEVFRRALRGDTTDASTRLDACGADADLVALAKACLAPEPVDRPRDAGVVAGRVTAYLAGVQEKLRTAERELAVAEARAVEERHRRKLQVGLAAAVLALTTVGGLSGAYYLQQKQARAAAVDRTLAEATTLRDQALAHADDPARWQAALAAIRRAEDAVGSSGSSDAPRQLAAMRAEVQAGLDAAGRDLRLLARLIDIRSARADEAGSYGAATDPAYASAFKEAGLDLATLPPAAVGEQIKARPPATALALVMALDDWADVRRRLREDQAGAKRISEAARAADPDPWRRELRSALELTDRAARLAALQATARSARLDALSAVSLDLLGKGLDRAGDPAAAETVLRAAQRSHPGDLWINHDLALVCRKRGQPDEAIRFLTAVRAIRPEACHDLAWYLADAGKSDEAIAVYQELRRLRPRDTYNLWCLGRLLQECGGTEEARQVFDAGVAAGREDIRRMPNEAWPHVNLSCLLRSQGKRDEAIAECRAALRLKPNDLDAHQCLGAYLQEQGKLDEAVAEHREELRIEPDNPYAHNNYALTLRSQGKFDAAIAELHESIRLDPSSALPHRNLGDTLKSQGKLDLAIAAYRAALRIKPNDAYALGSLCDALVTQGKLDAAEAVCRERIRVKPDDANALGRLGWVLQRRGQQDASIEASRAALRLDSIVPWQLSWVRNNLVAVLKAQGKPEDVITEYRELIRLKPGDATLRYDLGWFLYDSKHDYEGAITEYREAIRINPKYAAAYNNLGRALRAQGTLDEAVAAFREAIRITPGYTVAHNNLGLALLAQGKREEARAEFAAAIRNKPGDVRALGLLVEDLIRQRALGEAEAVCREAIRQEPNLAEAHGNLGRVLLSLGQLDASIDASHEALRLNPNLPWFHNNLGAALRGQKKFDEAIAECREAIRIDPRYVNAHNNLGAALRGQKKFDEAIAAYLAALRLNPDDAAAENGLEIALREQGDLEGAEKRSRETNDDHLLRACGEIHAHDRRWYEAARDFERVAHLAPSNLMNWYRAAAAVRITGDEERYRRVFREMMDHFGATQKVFEVDKVFKLALLTATTAPEGSPPGRVVEGLLSRNSGAGLDAWFWCSLALADHRAGEPARALKRLDLASAARGYSRLTKFQVLAWVIRALAHDGLGQRKQARHALDQAESLLRTHLWQNALLPGDDWIDWTFAASLYREAEARIIHSPIFPRDPFVR